jgi:hypothetical protein
MAKKVIKIYLPPRLRKVEEEMCKNMGISDTELMRMILVNYALHEGYLTPEKYSDIERKVDISDR